ncbi:MULTISPECIES: thermonuclease family protein [Rhizobium]|uniref:Endonuclease YncB(Thermonuclease family) n=1 Tax=Rhizobium paranaense TaxID=1650438 RepID=A0A7W9D249_9HYPH|nr:MULTISPECIES: thermonuclease family protein [Rhizobium]MBB5575044.1 endonuclease YncB(thermonuclease family) [Rhizobium paranaense]PST64516.1 hypothetical protein C9E91_03295 [Rhizobium sp. SEMIA4064]
MRRDVWLASLAGVVLGSWVTLVAVQVEEHGFSLSNRAGTESAPVVSAPTETAKAVTPATATSAQQPADTTKPDGKTAVQPAAVAAQATPAATTTVAANGDQSATTSSDATASPPTPAPTATPTSTLEGTAKALVATSSDQINKDQSAAVQQPTILPESKASAELAQPQATPVNPGETQVAQATPTNPAPSNQTDAYQTPASRMPADQMDREQAAEALRTEPAEPPSQQASTGSDEKPIEQAKPVELVRPFSDRAGILTIAGKSVQLPGIIPTDVERMCTGPNGKSWPCGAAARTAFRMYLRGRTIDCDLPNPTWQGTVTGACRYVRVDLSEWLVRFGWAEPEAGSPLVALAEQAKQQKRGIYGDDPRAGGKSTLAPPPAKENPLNPI